MTINELSGISGEFELKDSIERRYINKHYRVMLQTISTNNYSRAGMAAMLSALPREELQWTMAYLNSMVSAEPAAPQGIIARPLTAFRGFCSAETDMKALRRRAMRKKFGI